MVCTQEDDFTFEQPRWLAHLSNGEVVIQDDNRPGMEPPQAWLRLAEYCRQKQVDIVNLTLQFRSHYQAPLPANAEGYYFSNAVVADWTGPTLNCFVIGYQQGNEVFIQWWKIPELICFNSEVRPAVVGPNLIRRNNEPERISTTEKESR